MSMRPSREVLFCSRTIWKVCRSVVYCVFTLFHVTTNLRGDAVDCERTYTPAPPTIEGYRSMPSATIRSFGAAGLGIGGSGPNPWRVNGTNPSPHAATG